MNSPLLSYAVCRGTIAFIWFYQGLIPKLLYPHEDELAMSMAAGFSHSGAVQLAAIAGVLEIAMAVVILIFWRQRWPLLLTLAAMVGLLAFVMRVQPILLGGAFNPITTNAAVAALSIASLHLLQVIERDR
ncbi:DoxX-like family protein [Marinobacter sp. DY40_1A1]|uniref:DoxX-like family protein n=1 Tax=Marinobacter sp. DY40_1A1 TaxID=2583229 RepID=UPI00190624FB|nr:DoxX-like family protein [Marinobacter sp. DY40_1A1]MBK1887630.1 DoxX-like family protein [Marinobacter sp. DY40_1A1]